MINFDCIVVGGGLQGLWTAAELVRYGVRTALLEQDKPTLQSSWAAGGILSPLYPWREPAELHALIRWNQTHYPRLMDKLVKKTGLDPEWQQCGMYIVATPEAEVAQDWAKAYKADLKLKHAEAVSASSLATGTCIHLPEVAQLRPPRLLQALRQYLLQLGVVLREQVRVDGLRLRGRRIEGVNTEAGLWRAKQVVIAAGAWSSRLLPGTRHQTLIKPIRGQIICYQTEPGYLPHIIVRDGYYAIPRRDGLVLVGSTLEDVGFDNRVTRRTRRELVQAAKRLLPGLEQFKLVHHWSGLRPAGVGTRLPFIGPHPELKGLYLNTGHYRNGILLAPGSARLLVALMLERQPIVPSRPFAVAGRLTEANI